MGYPQQAIYRMDIADMRSVLYELIQTTTLQLTADAPPPVIVSEVVQTNNSSSLPSLFLSTHSSHHSEHVEDLLPDEVRATGERNLIEANFPVTQIVSVAPPACDETEPAIDGIAHEASIQTVDQNHVIAHVIKQEALDAQPESILSLPTSSQEPRKNSAGKNGGSPRYNPSNDLSTPCEWCGGTAWQEREDGLILCTCYFRMRDQVEKRTDVTGKVA